MGHFDWQSTRLKPARNVGSNGQWDGGGAVRLVIRHEESRWRSVNDDRNAWPFALCMTRAAHTRPLINHVDCNMSVTSCIFRSISQGVVETESNLKEEKKEERIKLRCANGVNRGDENWMDSKRRKKSVILLPVLSLLPIFSRKSWRKDI